ncbi:putative intracellular protease/amidase [Streptosporangium becharense]|uniref:Putative intracellular protease/amidase n=1 Tax=Streptosporangium becharense TaxID=1816182 RepID=A0A7W9IC41_9ACTN|nr:type 1 glutamine amidotransferase domain-containing protein [Streptosporangium becharense]MBB2915188.1 putative intracellular protease/amidase [Streptosporangium becharense]MBB5817983.1 putative intracellular protease/amidase [Streptosporangium becharense]
MAKILMIISAADSLTLADGTAHPTGYWAEEVAASHRVLREAGVEVDIATPGGASPTVDPVSLDERGGVAEADAKEFRDYLDSIADDLARPLSVAEVSVSDYDGVYIPGGHGPMTDLARDPDLGRLLDEADRRGQVIAALCHGPAALLSTARPDGGFTFAGRRLTVFTDDEEHQGGLGDRSPYFVETRLRELGAVVEAGPAWASKVVVDGNLISGQNPQSSVDTANRVLTALDADGAA